MKILKHKLFRETMIYSVGSFGSKVLAFIMVPLYSYYLSVEDLGVYDLCFAVSLLLTPVVSLQLNEGIYRFLINEESEERRKKVVSSSFFVLILNCILFLAIYILSNFTYNNIPVVYPVLMILLGSLLSIIQFTSRGLGKTLIYAITGLFYTIILFVFNVVGFFFKCFDLSYLLNVTVISQILTILFSIVISKFWRFISIRDMNISNAIPILKYSIPLIPSTLIWFAFDSSNKFIIANYLGVEANGLFAMASKFATVFVLINSMFSKAWNDYVINDKNNTDNYSLVFKSYSLLLFSLSFLMVAINPYLFKYLISSKFYEAQAYSPFFYLISITSLFGVFLVSFYLKKLRSRLIAGTDLIGFLFNLAISFALVERLGIYGVLIGSFIGFMIVFILRFKFISSDIQLNNVVLLLVLSYLLFIVYLTLVSAKILSEPYQTLIGLILFLLFGFRFFKNFSLKKA